MSSKQQPRAVLDELRLGSAPLSSEEGRALLQERIGLFARTAAMVSFAFLVVGNSIRLVIADRPAVEVLVGTANGFHVAGAVTSIVIWRLACRARLGAGNLFALDLTGTLLPMAFYAAMVASLYRFHPERFDLVLILIALVVVTLRAIAVPSTPRQTALISALGTAPTIGVAYVVGQGLGYPSFVAPLYAVVWCCLATFVATFASRVIYGLRRKAADAERLGQYVLDGKIGEGGMGSVYRARHALMRRPTAIKLLPPDKAGEQAISRFEREVQNTSRLTHPNTVAIYDYGRTPEGVFYYAMEYLDGLDLQKLVDRFGRQPAARVVHILQQVCGSLAEAHEAGVVHRDVKPANIILCMRGGIPDVAKVVDFGLAKDVSAEGDPQLSNVNALIGTPLYISPEAIVSPQSVDSRTDLYALGAVGYFLLTGEPVFGGSSLVEVCAGHLHQAPVPPSAKLGEGVPDDLEKLLLACLAKNKDERPTSARALRAALLECKVEPWTEESARQWWAESPARAPLTAAATPLGSDRTVVAVDMAARVVK